jgi:hypothetical protein
MNTEQAIQRLREVVRRQHNAISTESTYAFWLRRYMLAIPRYAEELTSEQKLERFLTELSRDRDISASMRIFRGGTEADHADAWEWAQRFLTPTALRRPGAMKA